MANTGQKGIDVRQTGGGQLVFRAFLQSAAGALVTTGTTILYLYELQSDGTLSSYDFSSNTFKITALTTETLAMTVRTGNNSTTNTGIWTAILATLTGFTNSAIYFVHVNNALASPTDQTREFQFGGAEGDLLLTSTFLQVDVTDWKGATAPAMTGDAFARLGAPAGASIAADLAEIEGETDLIGTDTAGVTTLLARIPGTVQAQTGDSYARLGAPVGASISADIAEIEAETDGIGSDTAGVTTLLARIPGTVAAQTGDSYARLGAPAGLSIAADLAEIEGETDAIGSDTAGVTTLLTRIPGTVQPQTGDSYARLGAPVGASISADIAEVEGETDSLVAGVTVAGYASNQDPATLLAAWIPDGAFTLKQIKALEVARASECDRTWNAGTHTSVVTYYRRAAGLTTRDITKPIEVITSVYDSTNAQLVSQTVVYSNLP